VSIYTPHLLKKWHEFECRKASTWSPTFTYFTVPFPKFCLLKIVGTLICPKWVLYQQSMLNHWGFSWRFPKMGGTYINHYKSSIFWLDFPSWTIQLLGYPHDYGKRCLGPSFGPPSGRVLVVHWDGVHQILSSIIPGRENEQNLTPEKRPAADNIRI
jgi:hypothetical protein